MALKVKIEVEDVGGSFKRFRTEYPKEAALAIQDAVEKTAFSMLQRMKSLAPVGPDAPHIKDALTYKRRGQRAEIGLLEATGPAAPGSSATMAEVGLYNEYNPNRQPFMRPAAEAENADFTKRITLAIQNLERVFSVPDSVSTGGSTSSTFHGNRRGGKGTGGQVKGN